MKNDPIKAKAINVKAARILLTLCPQFKINKNTGIKVNSKKIKKK